MRLEQHRKIQTQKRSKTTFEKVFWTIIIFTAWLFVLQFVTIACVGYEVVSHVNESGSIKESLIELTKDLKEVLRSE